MNRIYKAITAYRLARFFGFPVHIAIKGALRKLTETKKMN